MSLRDKTSAPVDLAAVRERLESESGPRYWKSLEEAAETPEFRRMLAEEFPSQAEVWNDPVGRRRFLHLMGASLALAGVTGCTRQPKEYIMPYAANPPEGTPGQAEYYATAMPFGGYGEPLLAESHMYRPTKLEGNPDHPLSKGASSVFAQASVLDMYDPDRLRTVQNRGRASSWGAFGEEIERAVEKARGKGGAGLRILSGSTTSPTLKAATDRLRQAMPGAKWHQWEPVNGDAALAASMAAFGEPVETHYALEGAKVILSLDADILANTPGGVAWLRGWAAGRNVGDGSANMNRLYVVEPTPTVSGTNADHRLRLKASLVEGFAAALAAQLGVPGVAAPELPEAATAWIAPLAADLQSAGAASVVIAGAYQTPGVHALAHAINAHLGAVGSTVTYTEAVDAEPVDQLASIQELVSDMWAGEVDTLLILGGNPSYDTPADVNFAGGLDQVGLRIMSTLADNETSLNCHWRLPAAHYLEAWGDIRAKDGSLLLQQPMIEPLFLGKSALELLAMLLGEDSSGYDMVRATFAGFTGAEGEALEKAWRKALHDGIVAGAEVAPKQTTLAAGWASVVSPAAPSEGMELVLRPDPTVWDGSYNNNGWLQELPKPVTKLTWENTVLVSPAAAERMSLRNGDVVSLGAGDATVSGPIWIVPGQADDVAAAHLGYGRETTGRVGVHAGFNAYALQTAAARWSAAGVSVAKRQGEHVGLACVQDHGSMEGRHLVRHATAAEYEEHPDFAHRVGHHGGGEEHPEPGVGSPFVGAVGEDAVGGPVQDQTFHTGRGPGIAYADVENEKSFFPEWNYTGYAWGMTIDLNKCVGCNACMAACQSENNIPVVGKDQVQRGREMHWIRMDRYFSGSLDDPATYYQPVPCMQCENAPCEPVCPVGATVHSNEGTNDMVYNRCVGTRYCANNCPYKVRRFNFLLYQDFVSDTLPLQRNPDVTVRSRGVMEKCTYCVQRINHARINSEKESRLVRDGEIQTACQQVCPAEAITFGDINDAASRSDSVEEERPAELRHCWKSSIRSPAPLTWRGCATRTRPCPTRIAARKETGAPSIPKTPPTLWRLR